MTLRAGSPLTQGHTVIISPHFDDAIMSLGATIFRATNAGSEVTILTVFGGSVSAEVPASEWDRKAGFATAGASARARREEDRAACLLVGAKSAWLDFDAEPYPRGVTLAQLSASIAAHVAPSDAVLLPGYPLEHADHLAVARATLEFPIACRRMGVYVEQPYAYFMHAVHRRPAERDAAAPSLAPLIKTPLEWTHVRASTVEARLKNRAMRAYASQLRQLGLGRWGRFQLLREEGKRGGESFGWLHRA